LPLLSTVHLGVGVIAYWSASSSLPSLFFHFGPFSSWSELSSILLMYPWLSGAEPRSSCPSALKSSSLTALSSPSVAPDTSSSDNVSPSAVPDPPAVNWYVSVVWQTPWSQNLTNQLYCSPGDTSESASSLVPSTTSSKRLTSVSVLAFLISILSRDLQPVVTLRTGFTLSRVAPSFGLVSVAG